MNGSNVGPLNGRRIVITRAVHQQAEITDLITARGGIAVDYPCLAITPPTDLTTLDASLQMLNRFDWLIVTSRNTVFTLTERLEALNLMIDWQALRVAVVGPATAEAVTELWGVQPYSMPDDFYAEALVEALPDVQGARIFLPQSARADATLTDALSARGADVTAVTAYENVIGSGGADVPALLQAGLIDALTFTSGSTVRYFCERVGSSVRYDVLVVCIGDKTANVARSLGFQQVLVPDTFTVPAMIDALSEYFTA